MVVSAIAANELWGSRFDEYRDKLQASKEMLKELCYNDELTLTTIVHSLEVLCRLYIPFWDVFPVLLRAM